MSIFQMTICNFVVFYHWMYPHYRDRICWHNLHFKMSDSSARKLCRSNPSIWSPYITYYYKYIQRLLCVHKSWLISTSIEEIFLKTIQSPSHWGNIILRSWRFQPSTTVHVVPWILKLVLEFLWNFEDVFLLVTGSGIGYWSMNKKQCRLLS